MKGALEMGLSFRTDFKRLKDVSGLGFMQHSASPSPPELSLLDAEKN
jgi:hypothetical protein